MRSKLLPASILSSIIRGPMLALSFLTILSHSALADSIEDARVGDFSLLDAHGYFHSMSWYDDHRALVFLSHSSSDPAMPASIERFESLAQNYASTLEFFLIDSEGKQNRDAIAASMAALGSELPVLMDDAQLIGEALALSHSGEFLVFDPRSFSVIGRGHDLQTQFTQADSLLSAIADEIDYSAAAAQLASATAGNSAVAISYPAQRAHAANTPSYRNDIAPTISGNCTSPKSK